MSHGVLRSLTHAKHVVVPYWKTTGKIITTVKIRSRANYALRVCRDILPWDTPLTWGKTVKKGRPEMLYLLLLCSSPAKGSTDLLEREVPSVLYG